MCCLLSSKGCSKFALVDVVTEDGVEVLEVLVVDVGLVAVKVVHQVIVAVVVIVVAVRHGFLFRHRTHCMTLLALMARCKLQHFCCCRIRGEDQECGVEHLICGMNLDTMVRYRKHLGHLAQWIEVALNEERVHQVVVAVVLLVVAIDVVVVVL
jgi:hypothetical protein